MFNVNEIKHQTTEVPGMIAANCLFTEGTSSLRKSMLQTSIYDRNLEQSDGMAVRLGLFCC